MRHLCIAVLVVLSTLSAVPVSAETPIEATLSLPHNRVLPGVPFDMVVTYTNVSKRPVTIASAVAILVVTFPNGTTSVLHSPEGNDQFEVKSSTPVVLPPGKSNQQALSLISIPNWFRYSSFSAPGTYVLALDLNIVDDDLDAVASLRTSPATLTRISPAGIDAQLWSRMQQVSDGRWASDSFRSGEAGAKLAEEIMQLHPSSEYYPYALVITARSRSRKPLPTLLEAAGRFLSSPTRPYLLLAAAESALSEARKAERRRDMTAALKFAQTAQTNYRDALATRAVGVQASGEEGLWAVNRLIERVSKKER